MYPTSVSGITVLLNTKHLTLFMLRDFNQNVNLCKHRDCILVLTVSKAEFRSRSPGTDPAYKSDRVTAYKSDRVTGSWAIVVLIDRIVVLPVPKSDRVPSIAGHLLDPPLALYTWTNYRVNQITRNSISSVYYVINKTSHNI